MANENCTSSLTEKVVSKELVFTGKLINVEHWQVKLPNGEDALREVACHIGASAIAAIDENDNIVLVRQCRVAVDKITMEIPAGKFNYPGEDPLECAKRELSEETGLSADNWSKLTVMMSTPGFCNERIHIFLAKGLHSGKTHPDEDEFVSSQLIPLKAAVQMVMEGTITDSKTALAIMMASALSQI